MNEDDLDRIVENYEVSLEAKKAALSTTITKQIVIYLVSFFLPPFGLGWAFKYLRSSDEKAKKIGLIVVILTIISLFLSLWISKAFIDNATQSVKSEMQLEDFNY